MAKYIQIQVEHPCQQKWEDMQPGAAGNFCSSCKKTVIDFTCMTDNQLMEYVRKHPSGVCGRFYNDQLDTKFEIPVKRIPWLKYFFQITLPAMLLSYKAGAQRMIRKQMEEVVVTNKKLHKSMELADVSTIAGSITGKDGKPVPFASVMVSGTNEGTAADSNGLFRLRLPGTVRTLEITAVGYQKKEVVVTGNYIHVQLDIVTMEAVIVSSKSDRRRCSMTMGAMVSGVTIRTLYDEKDRVIAEKPASIVLFPNPVRRDGLLTIRWKKPVTNNQQVIIYDAAGVKLLYKFINIKQSLQQTQLTLDLDAAGYYLVEVIDVKSKEKVVLKLIVE